MGFWDLVYPKKCLGCGRPGKYFCDSCLKKVDLCGECFNCRLSLFCYRGLIREAVKQLKFKSLRDIEGELRLLIESGLSRRLKQPDTVMFKEFLKLKPAVQPVPLFWFRENRRGYNQAEILAGIAAKALKLPLVDCLRRGKLTRPQTRLSRRRRLVNVKGIFQVKSGPLPEAVLLVDDVWTTGATMTEAIKTLRQAGVKAVWALTLAR